MHLINHPKIQSDSQTYVCLMQRYLNIKYVKGVKIVHTHMIDTRFNLEVSLNNKFISMYAESDNLEDTHQVFDKIMERNMVSWTTVIGAYTRHWLCEYALNYFTK